jgi:hypothetical protein
MVELLEVDSEILDLPALIGRRLFFICLGVFVLPDFF